MPTVKVDQSVFEKFPDFRRGIVIAGGMDNRGVSEELAREAFKLAAAKLPVRTTFVNRTVM